MAFSDLVRWREAGWAVCVSTPEAKATADESQMLPAKHSFALVRAVELRHGDLAGTQLLLLRNPWGSDDENTSPWSPSSDEMNRCRAAAATLTGGGSPEAVVAAETADGTFWLSFDRFRACFQTVSLCMLATTHDAPLAAPLAAPDASSAPSESDLPTPLGAVARGTTRLHGLRSLCTNPNLYPNI